AESIWIAAGSGDQDAVQAFLSKGGDANAADERGYSVLHAGVSWGHEAVARLLLEAGADPNRGDVDGDTPLHVVELPAVARLLLAYEADPLVRNNDDQL
ncbi:hypothetical protein CXG81DRAFT_2428, partial [Caulochytrium protostelioides]